MIINRQAIKHLSLHLLDIKVSECVEADKNWRFVSCCYFRIMDKCINTAWNTCHDVLWWQFVVHFTYTSAAWLCLQVYLWRFHDVRWQKQQSTSNTGTEPPLRSVKYLPEWVAFCHLWLSQLNIRVNRFTWNWMIDRSGRHSFSRVSIFI